MAILPGMFPSISTIAGTRTVGITLESNVGIHSKNNEDLLVVIEKEDGARLEISILDMFNRIKNLEDELAEFYLLKYKEKDNG